MAILLRCQTREADSRSASATLRRKNKEAANARRPFVRHQINLAAKAIRTTPTTPSRAICSQRFLVRVVTCISMCITSLNYLYFSCRADADQMDSAVVLHGSHHWLELFAGAITPLMSDTSDV